MRQILSTTCYWLLIFLDSHWSARAANSTARSLGTGSRPWRMSSLTWRKNWYLENVVDIVDIVDIICRYCKLLMSVNIVDITDSILIL